MKKIDKKLAINILKYLFLVLVLYYVTRFMVASIRELGGIQIRVDYRYIVAALLIHLAYLISRASIWHYITCLNRVNLPYLRAVNIWFVSLLGKFIPGKVLYVGARVYHYKKNGKSGSIVTYSFFLEYMTSIAASVLLFVVSFSFIPMTSFHHYRGLGIALIASILLFLHPRVLNYAIAMANKVLKRKLPALKDIKYLNILAVTGMYLVSWSILGSGFYCLVNSVYPLPIADFLYAAGSFALATIIGILSLFAPSGIGVREGVIIATMSQIMPAGMASIVSILARVWATGSELVWIMVVSVSGRVRLPKTGSDQELAESQEV